MKCAGTISATTCSASSMLSSKGTERESRIGSLGLAVRGGMPMQGQTGAGNKGPEAWQDDRLPHQQWQGREAAFMRSNEHSRERQGVWNSEGLQGAALALVEGDQKHGK